MNTLVLPADRFIDGALPLYDNVTLITAERHGDLQLTPDGMFGFARGAAIVPLTMDEFERAALDYPIVFLGPARRVFAVMGLAPDRNLFIGANDVFKPGAYIPAYLRRHPFALVEDKEQGRWVLGVDETSERLASSGAAPLFVDGEPTETLLSVVTFCESYQNAHIRTENWVRLLDELDLLEPRQAHYQSDDDAVQVLLLDYVAINRERLEELDTAAVAQLRALGGWGPAYAHLLSAGNWERLTIAAAC